MYFVLGILFLFGSFIPWFIHFSPNLHTGMLFAVMWGIGYLLICEGIIQKYSKKKKLPHIHDRLTHALFVCLIGTILIEAFGNWSWKLWYYPLFSVPLYLFTMPFIVSIYFYFLIQGYLSFQLLLLNYFGATKKLTFRKRFLSPLFSLLGIIGTFGIVWTLYQSIITTNISSFTTFFNSIGYKPFSVPIILGMTLSLWFILEFLEFKNREDSFLLHLLEGDWGPLVCVIGVSLVTSLTMEVFNIPVSLWVYTNWPLAQYSFLGLPITVLLSLPVQYILLISIYRVLFRRETIRIWD